MYAYLRSTFFELNTLLLAIRFFCSRSSLFYYTVSARTSPPSFVAKRDEVLTEKIVFEKFMPRIMKSSISGQNTLHLIDEERKKKKRRKKEEEEEDKASLFILAHFHWARYHETRWHHAEATETTTTVA